MGHLRKQEFILKYGEIAWQEELKKRTEMNKKWRNNNKDKVKKERERYNEKHPDKIKRNKNSDKGYRASMLLDGYKKTDKRYDRGECTITQKWILENIFSSKCFYCGESDWTKLGCDRIDNLMPHTPDNVVCSCWECNKKRQKTPFEEFVKINKGAA